MVTNDIFLRTIKSDFSQKSFVMLCVNNVCKNVFTLTLYGVLYGVKGDVEYDNFRCFETISFHNIIKDGIIDLCLVYNLSLFTCLRLALIYAVMCAISRTKCKVD